MIEPVPDGVAGHWRVTFDLAEVEGKDPVELRAVLKQGDKVLSETWMFQYHPFYWKGGGTLRMSQSSLTECVTPIEAKAGVVAADFLGRTPALALADGSILLAEIGAERRIAAHDDAAILVAASDGKRFLTGGDDGRVVSTDASGKVENIAKEKGWIDALACRDDGAIAWSSGKLVRARDAKGEVKYWPAPSSVRGLAFFPKGYRLAVAHYNGASLWFPNTAAGPEALEWKGSHLDATVSPDGRFVVTSMQENMLHGWRLADKKNMRMSGYPAKPRRCRGRMTAAGSPLPAPTAASSGRFQEKTVRWASRRANAACGPMWWSPASPSIPKP